MIHAPPNLSRRALVPLIRFYLSSLMSVRNTRGPTLLVWYFQGVLPNSASLQSCPLQLPKDAMCICLRAECAHLIGTQRHPLNVCLSI